MGMAGQNKLRGVQGAYEILCIATMKVYIATKWLALAEAAKRSGI